MRRISFVPVVILLASLLAACGGGGSDGDAAEAAGKGGGKLTLVAYSTPREAYAELVKGFTATPAGKGVTIEQSFGASGEQSRAVADGLPADVVTFSLEPDMTRLVDKGLVAEDWAND